MLKDPCQPQEDDIPKGQFGVTTKQFNLSWFKEFGTWLEYSVEKDAAYYLYCYLFRTSSGKQGRGESFVGEVLNVQKDIVSACTIETINVIIKDIGDSLFSILVDESREVSMKEQMSIVTRYLDISGHVNECFIGIQHATSTAVLSLKATIDKENPCDFYIHCFAHQIQLTLVVVTKKNIPITNFFRVVGDVVNTVGASSKRYDFLQEKQLDFIVEMNLVLVIKDLMNKFIGVDTDI
ncbi:uncharacterized protein LOC111395380 [Olea europaea var. sylvestris]|uniref:uncharacterized protein LOC111395380 n=1 Tax=Olea europaea var. sylvestris TaxID=158386 RepID=UPI000C1CF592|nr:uncharacterized protein LOC111395380 [Olea europaea var. sylvestris]